MQIHNLPYIDNMDKNIWELALQDTKSKNGTESEESEILIVGSKNSGKTSLLLRFLDRDDITKPTVALEYTFGRKAKSHSTPKDVGHIWELGGGTWLSRLIDIPLNPTSLQQTTLILFLDLSQPNELWLTFETLLGFAKSRIQSIIQEKSTSDPCLIDTLTNKSWTRVGVDNADKAVISPFLIPLIIIGGKYDLFQDFEAEKRKVICKTLRFVAHYYGATLCFFSVKHEQLVIKTRAIVSSYLFGTPLSKTLQTDHNKALIVPAGMDSMTQIGSPPLAKGNIGQISARTPLDLWKQAFTTHFPQENSQTPSIINNPGKDPQFAELAIDSLREQKDQELERYRRISDKKFHESLTNHIVY